jgi:phosphoribosylaminoimidazole carboxylase (NCAIR synthetase)
MTTVLENGQLAWIFEATTEELEQEVATLVKKHDSMLDEHQILLDAGQLKKSDEVLNSAIDLTIMISTINKELINRTLLEDYA